MLLASLRWSLQTFPHARLSSFSCIQLEHSIFKISVWCFLLVYNIRAQDIGPGQTIATSERNISLHCWTQWHVARVYLHYCKVLRHVRCCWLNFAQFKLNQLTQQRWFTFEIKGSTEELSGESARLSPMWLTVQFPDPAS